MAMDMNRMMKQARKMQADMEKAQAELAEAEFTASAGGGAVQATVYGNLHVKSVTIDPAAVDPDDVEMLQDLIVASLNEAIATAESTTQQRMDSITGSMNIPGLR